MLMREKGGSAMSGSEVADGALCPQDTKRNEQVAMSWQTFFKLLRKIIHWQNKFIKPIAKKEAMPLAASRWDIYTSHQKKKTTKRR